jgi:hypothetical protein
MSKHVTLVCDGKCGKPSTDDATVRTRTIGYDGHDYEVELCDTDALPVSALVALGRRAGAHLSEARPGRSGRVRATTPRTLRHAANGADDQAVWEWWQANEVEGKPVPGRKPPRIANAVFDAFDTAKATIANAVFDTAKAPAPTGRGRK